MRHVHSRSIGDCQLKDLGAASLYNSKFPIKVLPTPGSAVPDGQAAAEGSGGLVLPYIIPTPETKQASIGGDSFLIVGCDGVWDEMSSEDAVGIVARLLVEHPQADIAALFIEEVLQKAADRCANDYEEEEELTLAELKKRPAGKKTSASRSQVGPHSEEGARLVHKMQVGHAYLWEYSYKRLQLAQLLGQLGVFLKLRTTPRRAVPSGR
jgi:hypothetical protein